MRQHDTGNTSDRQPWRVRIDTGGTFTDCIGRDPQGKMHRCKVLSSGSLRGRVVRRAGERLLEIGHEWYAPDRLVDGFGFHLADRPGGPLGRVARFDASRSTLLLDFDPDPVPAGATFELRSGEEAPVLGIRLLTETLPGEPFPEMELRLSTTRGTNALLERRGADTLLLITGGFGDLLRIGDQRRPELFSLRVGKPAPFCSRVIEIEERIGSDGKVLRPPDPERFEELLGEAVDAAEAVAVCLLNSYRNPEHEELLAGWLERRGVRHLSVSSRLVPEIGILPRAGTTGINAYLSPVMRDYLENIREQTGRDFYVMTSSGSLSTAGEYEPKEGLLSGPAGGVTGAAAVGRAFGIDKLITFDMGGTSTDVSRFDGTFDLAREQAVSEARISAPAIAIETVAAGGGSICDFDGKSLTVGPRSAGADPGPACYGAGGPLTITDVNLLSGRLDPSNFHLPVDLPAAEEAFRELRDHMAEYGPVPERDELLEGLLEIANEKMAQAISAVSGSRGFDPADYTLVAFGGAGGQHATAVAGKLGIRRILMPADSGLLSAAGLDLARPAKIETMQLLLPLRESEKDLPEMIKNLTERAGEALKRQLPPGTPLQAESTLFLRFSGQESTLEIPWREGTDLASRFRENYLATFGHRIDGRAIEVESIRTIVSTLSAPLARSRRVTPATDPKPLFSRTIRWKGNRYDMPVYRRIDVPPGSIINGPALLLDPWTTLFLEPGWRGEVRSDETVEILCDEDRGDGKGFRPQAEAVRLQLYTNRFASIAERMGEMLRRTSLSVNVKERLDFSCALLDSEGFLVANAPHIPVHLGAMGLCARTVLRETDMREGDVLLTNHPGYGGSHLPDLTLLTPVFHRGERIALVASRAHHAEIGGRTPGSMPPDATRLSEEGVIFPPFRLFDRGEPQWEEVRRRLGSGPWPSRSIEENLADLQAAVAANHHGSRLLLDLVGEHGEKEVTRYMNKLHDYASERMSRAVGKLRQGVHTAEEHMDDGSRLSVSCRVDGERLEIDFAGCSPVHPGNLNATPAIVQSVVIYVLRLLVDEPLPLNDGLLKPVSIRLPESMLNPPFPTDPDDCPAVVGGNTETSQRLTDTLLKAFGLSACSQGTMNNLLFGNERFGYYETVAGGTGAGEGFDGADGVHHHMTNTRATDPEILEHRYPVRLERFSIRRGSGGAGRWHGGNGLVRTLLFLEPLELSLLTQHRKVAPYGMQGGEPGAVGRQTLYRRGGSAEQLDWKDVVRVEAGDRLELLTPGGGGFGVGERTDGR